MFESVDDATMLDNDQRVIEEIAGTGPGPSTANKKRKYLLKLTRSQLIALVLQKKAMPYYTARTKTTEELVELLYDLEGALTPDIYQGLGAVR